MVDRKSGEGNGQNNEIWLPQKVQTSEARNLSGFTRFIYSPSFRLVLSAAVAAGYTISQLPFLKPDSVRAEGSISPALTPIPEHILKGMMPSQEFNGGPKEVLQVLQDQIEFDIDSDHYQWGYNNASGGIYPPNNPAILTGTVGVVINGIYYPEKNFQGMQSFYKDLYGGIFTQLALKGMAVNLDLNRFSLVTFSRRPMSQTLDVHIEGGFDIKNAEKYLGRQMVDKGLPTGGFSGAFSVYATEGKDERGYWMNAMFAGGEIPEQDGTYQARRTETGEFYVYPDGTVFKKISNSIVPEKPFQAFAPIIFR